MIRSLLLTGLFAFLTQFGYKTLLTLDFNKKSYNHRPGECRIVKGPVHGSEDIEIIDKKGLAFITSGIVYLPHEKPSQIKQKGKMFVYQTNRRDYTAKPVDIVGLDDASNFHPHGMSHWILADGTIRLFVVVHSKIFEHSIVVLDFDEKQQKLKHVRTIKDEKFVRPNDIAATGEMTFLVSNDGSAQTGMMNVVEFVTGVNGGSVIYYDGQKTYDVIKKRASNGISLSTDKKTLIVSHINEKNIGIYSWNEKKRIATPINSIDLYTSCDNFHIDNDNNIWTGCHPILKDAIHHLANFTDQQLHSPSQVLRIKFSKDYSNAKIVELFHDEGTFISASSIAANFDSSKQLLIGSVARQLVHCDINIPIDY